MKMCEQILKKKDSAPIQFKFFEFKKHSRKNSGSDSKRRNFTNKTVIATEATTLCIKPLTHYVPRSALKIGET